MSLGCFRSLSLLLVRDSEVPVSSLKRVMRLMVACWLAIGLVVVAGAGPAFGMPSDGDASSSEIQFNRDIRPILSDHCFACHGPDANKREADLRLDTAEGIEQVVVAMSAGDSELFRRVADAEPDEVMPPPEFQKDLSEEQIELLKRWIDSGASWQGHWAFQPIGRPTVPDVVADGDQHAAANEVDAFLLRDLRDVGLELSGEADRRTLIRRLSFDLTGLPPEPEEVAAFLADTEPGAYERLVDRLLQSPHYGERMAMWWLDLVRYADSVGYHGDQEVSVSPFRDYVIASFNSNKPFDQFTVEQLAGDLLPAPTREQQIAAGYNRLGMMSAEGGVQPKEYLAKYIAERVRNLGGTWLGVTLGCCECHDHKYDPFTTRDFYQFESFFADIKEQGLYSGANASGRWGPTMQVPSEDQAQRLAELDTRIEQLKSVLTTGTAELAEAQKGWEDSLPVWTVLNPVEMTSEGEATLEIQEDGSILVSGAKPEKDVTRLVFDALPEGVTALRLEVLPDESLPNKGSGRAGNGNFVLTEWVTRVHGSEEQEPREVAVGNPSATFEQAGAAGGNPYGKWAIAAAFDGDEKGANWGWAIMEQVGKPQAAVVETTEDLSLGEGERLEIELRQGHDNASHTLGRFRLSVTTHVRPIRADAVPNEIAAILKVARSDRSEAEQATLSAHYRTIAPLLEPTRRELAKTEGERKQLDQQIRTTLVTVSVEPRMIRVLPRGNWMDDSGAVVEPDFPEFLGVGFPESEQRMSRLDLARWVLDADNPLTARVFVNRVWKMFYGEGISRKLDDLGAQGEWPSHPEMLDYLASEFVESGWNVKGLVKKLVMSRAYRQSSQVDDRRLELDPFNRLLSRQSRFRLPAEMVRDNALEISGLLVESLGGESVKPYQPPGYWAYLNFPTRTWQKDSGDELYRRGLYVHWQRQYLHPSLLAFDAPSREECTADRPRSNTPLQSLVLLNDPIYVEAARVFAETVLREAGETAEERIDWMFEKAVAREATDQEVEILGDLVKRHEAAYREDIEAAKALVSVGDAPIAEDIDPAEWAAWTNAARAVLNLHETITRN